MNKRVVYYSENVDIPQVFYRFIFDSSGYPLMHQKYACREGRWENIKQIGNRAITRIFLGSGEIRLVDYSEISRRIELCNILRAEGKFNG